MAKRSKGTTRNEGPKGKNIVPEKRGRLQHKADNDDNDTIACSRPRREVKGIAVDQTKAEEDAQLQLAIRLSLNEQKKANSKKPCKQEKPVNSKKVQKKADTAKPKPIKKEIKKKSPIKINNDSDVNKTPTKKIKVKSKKTVNNNKRATEIPSTSSYISFVLQKGAKNRDMSLVKLFEQPTVKEASPEPNATAEPETS